MEGFKKMELDFSERCTMTGQKAMDTSKIEEIYFNIRKAFLLARYSSP